MKKFAPKMVYLKRKIFRNYATFSSKLGISEKHNQFKAPWKIQGNIKDNSEAKLQKAT